MVARSTLQMDSSRVAVQNTFIHMIVDDAEATDLPNLKRSSSVPPSQRFGEQAAVKCDDECDADIDVSTDAGSVIDKEIIDNIETPTVSGSISPFCRSCTPCSLEDESPYQQQSLQDWPYGTCNWTAAAMPVYIVQAPVAVVNPSPAAAVEQNALPPVETTPKPTPLRLNSQALAWTPNAATAPPVSKKANKEAHALGRRLLLVVETVKSVLSTCLWISTVEMSENTLGHTLTLQVKPEHSDRQNDILMLAKAQISTSATSMGLHFVGHQTDPFVPMPTGAAVKLCHVKDVDKICWDLLRTGICSYGAHCHWKHPKSEKRIEVKIMLAESS